MVGYYFYSKWLYLYSLRDTGDNMTRFSLILNLGENATVSVGFDLLDDEGEPYVDFEGLEVGYRGVDIIDTLDQNDLAYLDTQIMESWDLIEDQMRGEWNDFY